MRTAIVFEAERTGYSIEQVHNAMTIGELRNLLDDYDDDDLFVLSHDNGYTYGSIDRYPKNFIEYEDGNFRED